MGSFAFSCSQEVNQMFGLRLLDFLVFDFPVMVFVEESEDLPEVLRLLFQELVENVEFSPFDFLVVVQIIGFQELLLQLGLLEVLEVFGVAGSLNVARAFLDHLEDSLGGQEL